MQHSTEYGIYYGIQYRIQYGIRSGIQSGIAGVHVSYTYDRTTIKYRRVSEAWIKGTE